MKDILRRLVFGLIAASVLAVSAGVLVVAAAYALFALVREPLGSAGAAAVVVLAAAVLMAVVGMTFALLAKPPKRPKAGAEPDSLQKLIAMAKDRPIISVGALIAAATLAIRNPALVAIVVKMFLDPKGPPSKKAK